MVAINDNAKYIQVRMKLPKNIKGLGIIADKMIPTNDHQIYLPRRWMVKLIKFLDETRD